MSTEPLYTERRDGSLPRVAETLPEPTRDALISFVQRKIGSDWLAREYPVQCNDGNSVAGTDLDAVGRDLRARVGCPWPLFSAQMNDDTLFDLLEYIASRAALPIPGREHSFWNHIHLTFDERQGKRQFREEVNALLRTGGAAFDMTSALAIQHVAAPETQLVMDQLTPNTGDTTVDALLTEGRTLFRSRRTADRSRALEKLWDGYERLKTIDVAGNKAASATALLAYIPDATIRAVVEGEMRTMTKLGNEFQIRHWETDKHPVPADAHEYFASRIAGLLIFLLRSSNRLSAS